MKWPGQRPSNIVNQAVTFPNVSRSYDATRRAVAFWGYDRSMEIDTRTIDQHVARLREKLGPEGAVLATVKNVGYRIKADA